MLLFVVWLMRLIRKSFRLYSPPSLRLCVTLASFSLMKHREYVYAACGFVMYLIAVIIYAEKQVRRI